MRSFHFKLASLVLFFTGAVCSPVIGQAVSAETSVNRETSAVGSDWETLRPDGEEFAVLMPKGSTFESSKEPYHKMELNTRIYISNPQSGPVFAVLSLSGIKSNPALYSEMQRVNSYVDAFKTFFPPKIRKGAIAKLTLLGDKRLQGHAGREYRTTLAELSGLTRVYATRKRFYAIVYLNAKKEESIQEKFMSSFFLPEKPTEPPPDVAHQPAGGQADPQTAALKTGSGEIGQAEAAAANKPDPPANGSDPTVAAAKKVPISGGVLNGKAYSLPVPDYPAEAKAAGASGTVTVQVTVDEQGTVLSAQAVSGHAMLHKAAVTAAFRARFAPTLLMGEPVKVTGIIVYNFGAPSN
ncbi:MAG: TonB family protein [Pyrinomonadaceae bacterium]